MHEILFRAKEISTDKWVEGYLVKISEDDYRIATEEDINWSYTKLGDYDGVMTCVNPETICQYTGLTDKNGNKIWENDVCYYDDMDVCVVRFGEYDNNTGHKHVGFYTAWRKYKYMFRSDIGFWVKERELEVIGNIFDNPELLEGR